MAEPNSPVEVVIAETATPEVVDAFARLLPQLSSSAARLTREALADIIGAPHNTVLLARDPSAGNRIVGTLTLVMFRIPSGTRAWIEDVVVDDVARGRGAGEALTRTAVDLARQRGAEPSISRRTSRGTPPTASTRRPVFTCATRASTASAQAATMTPQRLPQAPSAAPGSRAAGSGSRDATR
jgi:GNAT superfamily N-acetyltransferase